MENKRGFIMRNGTCIGMDVQRVYTSTPIGIIQAFSGTTIPRGFLLCDGANYLVKDYPDLYAVIGNTYGGNDTNFNVPNLVDKFIQGSTTSGTEKEAGLPNITGLNASIRINSTASEPSGAFYRDKTANYAGNTEDSGTTISFDASKSNSIYGNSDTVQPPALTMVYIIKAFHTNEGTDSGVSDDVIEYVEGEIAEVETALPNIKKFANPGGTAKYITISGATLGDIEVHSAYAGKYMFTSTGAKPIFFGTSTYLGYTLTGWAWNSDKTKLYLRVNGHRDFVISAFGSDGVEISDMTTTAPTDVTFNATFNYNAYIDNSTSENTSTYSSAKIDKKFAPRHFGTDNKTLYLKLQLGTMTTHESITVTDQYGGQVKILGMYDLSTYKSVKLIRLSYGDWSTHSGTDFTNTSSGDANYKIRRLFYCPNDNNYYLEIRQYSYISVEGAPDATMVVNLPVDVSELTLIPESAFASKTDLNLTTKLAQGGSPFTEMYSSESPYRKLTARCYYGRQQVFKVVASNGYSGKIFVAMHGVELNNAVVKVVTENGTAPFELKYGNTKALTVNGYYSIDLFIHKTKADVITLNIIPVAQGMSNYTITYTSADFVASNATDFESAEKTATFTKEYATKADLGSNVPMTEIAFTNSTNWSNSSGNLKTFYMVRNGWCFLHVVAHCNKVANDNNSVVYSGLPMPPFQVYGKFLGETLSVEPCELTITPDGKILLRGGTAGKDYSFTYTYPVA